MKLTRTNFIQGFIAAIGAQVCFSILEVTGTLVYQGGASVPTLLAVRFSLATFFFFLTIFFLKKFSFKIEKKDIGKLIFFSALLAGHILLFWQGIKTLDHIPTAVGIYFTFPFWVVIISAIFLREKFNLRRISSLVLGTVGALLAIKFLPAFSVAGLNLVGIGLMIAAAVSWAVALLIRQRWFKQYNAFTLLFYNFLICSGIFVLLQNPITTINELTWRIFGYIALMAVVSTYLAYSLIYISVKRIKASNASITSLIKPFLTIGLAFLVLGQISTIPQLIGIGLILTGTYLIYKEK